MYISSLYTIVFRCLVPHDASCLFFFFNDTATTEIYTLSLHDALPIWSEPPTRNCIGTLSPTFQLCCLATSSRMATPPEERRSEEYTSELQSQSNLVCRLLLEKKKK